MTFLARLTHLLRRTLLVDTSPKAWEATPYPRDTDTSAFHGGCLPPLPIAPKRRLPSVSKMAAHQLLSPAYAHTREAILLRHLMAGIMIGPGGARRILARHGITGTDGMREMRRLRACLRRDCIRPHEKRYPDSTLVTWLSKEHIAAINELREVLLS